MKAGSFNIREYLDKLYEAEEGGLSGNSGEGLIIPQENKKTYDWLKKEYNKGKTEVKVEIKMGGTKFEPGYELQTDLKSVKDFKPGMYGQVKTSDNEPDKKEKEEGKKEDKKNSGVQIKAASTGPSKKDKKEEND